MPARAIRTWTHCSACDALPVAVRFPDLTGACDACYEVLRAASAGCPDCPECGHRYWVRDLDERIYASNGRAVVQRPGRMFRCDCGLKFTREGAAADAAAPKLFAPRAAAAD